MNFPIFECNYKINSVTSDGTKPHTHTVTSEIIQTFESEGNVLINGKLYNMEKNNLFFIHGLSTHFVSPTDLNRYNHSIIILNTHELEQLVIHLDMVKEYNKLFTNHGGTLCSLSNEDVILADSAILEISKILSDNEGLKYARLASALTELFRIGLSSGVNTEQNSSKISDIISYVSDNALTKITIDTICENCHISKYHLCRIFKEHIGITIGDFIKNRRLSEAKQLLADTELSITKISYLCCFSDSSFFSKTFSKEFGISPTDFRAKYR